MDDLRRITRAKTLRIVGLIVLVICGWVILGVGLFYGSRAALRSPNARLRQPAVSLVLLFKYRSIPSLEEVLNNDQVDLSARLNMVITLGKLQSETARLALIRSLSIQDAQIQAAIQETLLNQGQSVVPLMVDALADPKLRGQAAEVIVHMSKSIPVQLDLHGVNLSGLNLAGSVLTGANLAKADLSGADLTAAVLSGVNLRDADLSGCRLNQADLTSGQMEGANLISADLTAAELSGSSVRGDQLAKAGSLLRAGLQGLDLRESNLAGLDLSGADLSGADLSSSTFTDTDFSDVNLSGAVLQDSNITAAQLASAFSLVGISLSGVDLKYGDLSGLDLSEADLSRANLTGANLEGTRLEGANLSGADLHSSNITSEQLAQAASLTGCVLTYQNLSGADLSGLDFFQAILDNADLSETNLSGTDLTEASLKSVNFSGSNITPDQLAVAAQVMGIKLRAMDYSDANFSGINLSSADFSGADLSYADFRDAALVNALFTRANLTGSLLTFLQLASAASLVGANLSGFDFSDADLSTMNLHGADLSGAIFNGADLSSAVLSETILTNADFSGAVLDSANFFHATGFTTAMLESAASAQNVQLQPVEEFFEQASLICLGNPVPEGFTGQSSFHPTIILWEQNYYTIFPAEHPLWINYLEQVACINTDERVIQTCTNYYYTSTNERAPDIDRIRYEVTVNIFEVATGKLVATELFKGSNPRYCQEEEIIPPTVIYGEPVEDQLIIDWVSQFTNEP